jgi:hypothetical protein
LSETAQKPCACYELRATKTFKNVWAAGSAREMSSLAQKRKMWKAEPLNWMQFRSVQPASEAGGKVVGPGWSYFSVKYCRMLPAISGRRFVL